MSRNQITGKMRSAIGMAALLLAATSAFAATVTKIDDDALAPLRHASVMNKVRLDKLPLYDAKRSVIDLEEFQVWAPGAKVIIHGDNGVVLQKLDPPPMRFFRGLVNGDPESFAFFSMEPSGRNIQGLVVTRDEKYSVSSARRPGQTPRTIDSVTDTDTFLTTFDDADTLAGPDQTWQCEVDKMTVHPPAGAFHATGADGLPVTALGISGTQSYAINIEVETDYELFVNAGSIAANVTNYITNLTGAVSTIYNRDLHTNVMQRNVHVYTSAADPWTVTATPASIAELNEIGDYYHNTYGGPLGSGVILLSGKNTSSGIAYEGVVCGGDFPNGPDWGGPYAYAGSINPGGPGTVPDPNATTGGVVYGMPSGFQTYWPLAEYAHEFGHVMGGHHTHCVAISDAERIAAGFTDGSPANSTSDFVDHCYAAEGAGCFSGSNYVAGSQSVYLGTIMSYCHNVFVGGVPQSRFTFGQAAEPSHHELDDYMLRAGGTLGGFGNIVSAVGSFTISAITAPASVGANSTGNAASISAIGGATYQWTATGGTITGGTTSNACTFTAGASGTVVLRATAYGTNGCGVTDTKSVTITTTTYNPPTNVVATAASSTSIGVTWTAASGTTPGRYNVYRSADGINYGLSIGNTTGLGFTDTTASANTAYLYKVRSAAADGTNESADSNKDFAVALVFTDSLTATVTPVRAVHFTQLRTAASALRVLAGQGATSYAESITANSTTIKASHITELRTYISGARTALGFSGGTYTTTPTTGSVISTADVTDLRNAVK